MRIRPAYVRQLASELELLPHGATSSFGASSSGTPGSREPSGELRPPHEAMLADWDAHGDRVLEKWSDLLKAWKGCGRVRPAGKTDREIVLEAGAGHSPDDVAGRYRCTPTMVRRWRVQDGRDGETGVPLRDVQERVRALRRQELSYRQIAERLGRSKSQVERVDKKEAA